MSLGHHRVHFGPQIAVSRQNKQPHVRVFSLDGRLITESEMAGYKPILKTRSSRSPLTSYISSGSM